MSSTNASGNRSGLIQLTLKQLEVGLKHVISNRLVRFCINHLGCYYSCCSREKGLPTEKEKQLKLRYTIMFAHIDLGRNCQLMVSASILIGEVLFITEAYFIKPMFFRQGNRNLRVKESHQIAPKRKKVS